MQEGNKKEKWGKPKLIVLMRGRPEEKVTSGCKHPYGPTGPFNIYHNCADEIEPGSGCFDCETAVYT